MSELTWKTTEFIRHEKSRSWYLGLWASAATFTVAGIVFGSFLVIVLVLLAALVIHIFAAKEPGHITVSLNEEELRIEEHVFSLSEFASFWIFNRNDHDILSLHHKRVRPDMHVMLPPGKAAPVRMLLRPHVPEETHEESLIDVLADRLKF